VLIIEFLKQEFVFEEYLLSVPKNMYSYLLKFRLRNTVLPGVRFRGQQQRDTDECPLCNELECDEFHFIYVCKYFSSDRKFIPDKYRIANVLNFKKLMNDKQFLMHLCKLSKKINATVRTLKAG
jgi:hypothetical protein